MLDKNPFCLQAINRGSNLILFLAKVAVMASTTAISIIWFKVILNLVTQKVLYKES